MIATVEKNYPIIIWLKNEGATYQGMMIALPPEDWQDLGTMSLPQFSSLLQDWANSVNLKAFTSAPRKPKKKKPKPAYDPRHPHVSTARLLAEKKKARFRIIIAVRIGNWWQKSRYICMLKQILWKIGRFAEYKCLKNKLRLY